MAAAAHIFHSMSEALIKTRDAKGKATRCLIYLGSDWPNTDERRDVDASHQRLANVITAY